MPVAEPESSVATEFASDVHAGLSKPGQKELDSKYLYDELGSALFEAITRLPEYGLTRADERILGRHAGEIGNLFASGTRIAELGSGSGAKTRLILEAFRRPAYHPIDISKAALDWCRRELSAVAEVDAIEGSYLAGLGRVAEKRQSGERLLVLFLGSNIGNFSRREAVLFLTDLRQALEEGDALLIGADMVKPAAQLLAAYDDPTGVTAAFNKNILGRINRELGGHFDLLRFAHEVRWEPEARRVEMHLRSGLEQTVGIPGAGLDCFFSNGETIWTESSYKYTIEDLAEMAAASGFEPLECWRDAAWPFTESLWVARPGSE